MAGLMAAFQDFWRENADMNQVPFEYNEAYPHIVLQAFLQRVINGGGGSSARWRSEDIQSNGKTIHLVLC